MLAAVVRRPGPPDVIELIRDWPKPVPKAGQVLIKVASTSVNPVDTYVRNGAYLNEKALPKILSGDVAGTIADANGVEGFAVGDRVAAMTPEYSGNLSGGTQAEYAVADASWLARVPESVNLSTAGAVPLVALTAWQAIHAANPKPGQKVLVLAASGGVGHMAVQLAKALGLRVSALVGPSNIDFVKHLGADVVVDYAADWIAALKEAGEAPFDFVIDPLGKQDESMQLLSPTSTYSVIRNARVDSAKMEEARAAHAAGKGPAVAVTLVQPDGKALETVFELIADGAVTLEVAAKLPLEKLSEGHRLVESKHTRGKVVITVP